ncbi:uncharacterized protein LOC107003738 [Solanum pennellii]|uniref:Uncharacterized protein LOC107003738 n=1 Tax=Solanum pennellii TaxID=28526 RepID=A0ABM1FIX7_SOLPN|nr:uncharacterized protein LOC107003738 [Solanum pennellii]
MRQEWNNYSGICREGSAGYFKCGQIMHFMREYQKSKKSGGYEGNRAQSSSAAQPDKAALRGATSSVGGGTNHLYTLNNSQKQENMPDVVTGMIRVFDFTVYPLLDPGASLSFLTLYISMNFEIFPEKLSEPFSVSTSVGESIIA